MNEKINIDSAPKGKHHWQANDESMFDVIVIGGGVVGCAMTREFTLQGAKVLLLEKAADILDGASKANSAILHTGFDAPTGSIELQCIQSGYQEYLKLAKTNQLSIDKSGAAVVAWNEDEESALESIINKAHDNGVMNVSRISASGLLKKEPNLSNKALGGAWVPNEFLIDPWTSPYNYLQQAINEGAQCITHAEVVSGHYDHQQWKIITNDHTFGARVVINCAGLYGDELDEKLVKKKFFEIKPRKGQFVVYDKIASKLLDSIILPVPNEVTKGIVLCRTIFGNLLVGPTAQEQGSRSDASVDKATLEMLCDKAQQILPALKDMPVTATYAGIRPATQFKDYCINALSEQGYISVGGIRSTGLSAALGLAQYIYKQYLQFGFEHKAKTITSYPVLSPLAENATRDWQKKGNKGMVCHCEMVTKREVEKAMSGPLAAKSLAGLKRRTRVTMGRCQGFYCSAQLAKITENCFDVSVGESIDTIKVD